MRLKHITAMIHARNMEFFRDRGTFFWNMIFPFFLIFGFAFAFSGDGEEVLTIGTFGDPPAAVTDADQPPAFLDMPGVSYRSYDDGAYAEDQVATHQIDLLIDWTREAYLVNVTSERGALAEQVLRSNGGGMLTRAEISGEPIRYIDWFVPGVIGINMMFSSLFGVGFVIVRYRKNGVLKRLRATPLNSLEFVSAQMVSRLLIVTVTSIIVFAGANIFLNFMMKGSYLLLLLVTVVSIIALISFGLVFAALFRSEEVASGVINVAVWPMLAFSGIFFSLENVPPVMRHISRVFPLTHFLEATRAVMLEGAGFAAISGNLAAMAVMTAVFLLVASLIFRWE